MRGLLRHADRVAIALILASAGAGVGMAWSSMTSNAMVWQRTAQFGRMSVDDRQGIDQFAAGRSWAQAAYDGGLRRCPEMNADFVAGCEAEIKALAARPDFAPGSYGGPLLVTAYTPPTPEIDLPAPPEPAAEPVLEPVALPETEAAFEPTPVNYPAAPAENE